MCAPQPARHTLSSGHGHSRWPGIVALNGGREREHVVRRSPALLVHVGSGMFFRGNGCVTTGFCSLTVASVSSSIDPGLVFLIPASPVLYPAHCLLLSLFLFSNPFISASHLPHPVLFTHRLSDLFCLHCVLSRDASSCCSYLSQHLNSLL